MCIESNMSSGLKHDEWSIVAIQFRNLMCCEKYLHMILWHTIHAVSLWSTSKIFVVCGWFKNTAANQQWPWITSILHWTLDLWLHFDRMYGISNEKAVKQLRLKFRIDFVLISRWKIYANSYQLHCEMCVLMLHVAVIEFTANKIICRNKLNFISSIRIAKLWLIQMFLWNDNLLKFPRWLKWRWNVICFEAKSKLTIGH